MTWQDEYSAKIMKSAALPSRELVRGEGCYVWDYDGNRYLDLSSQLVNVNIGHQHPKVVKAIQDNVYKKNKGNMEDKTRIGSIYYNRGVVHGIIAVEAIRTAQAKYGKGQVMTGEQMRWGFENLNIDTKRLKELGAEGFMPDMKVTCLDHEGSGKVKFQQWDGKQWKVISDWIDADKELVRPMIEESAAKYAKEKGITPRDCSKES